MARRSRGGGRGRGRGTARGRLHSSTRPSSQSWPPPGEAAAASDFSLVQEARWASNHRTHAFDSTKKLRNLKIEFVSAGCLEGTIKEKTPLLDSHSPTNAAAMANMTIRSPSPSSASSSEDEVVFTGRSRTLFTQPAPASSAPTRGLPTASLPDEDIPQEKASSATPVASATPQLTNCSSDEHVSLPAEETASSLALCIRQEVVTSKRSVDAPGSDIDSDTDSVIQDHFKNRLAGKSEWETNTTPWVHKSKPSIGWLQVRDRPSMNALLRGKVDPTAAAMEDYMQNVQEFGTQEELLASIPLSFSRREMDLDAGDHNDWTPPAGQKHRSGPTHSHCIRQEAVEQDGWNSDMLQDFDGLSTSSDVIDTIVCILSKRLRESGVQYLVQYEGSTPDDARWLPATFLKSPDELELIRVFEAEALSRKRELGSSSDSESGKSEDDHDDTDEEEDMDVDDERLARILQKQEELGLPSDDIVLFGGDEYFDGHTGDRPNKKRQRRSGRRSLPHYPSASVMADVLDMDPYNGFDVMDTERPSLRPKKKGRRGQMPPELEDSDLEEQRQAAWEADRSKKRIKKAEREEMRKQGLLGRKGKAPDLSVKYKDGVVMAEVVEEIRGFMKSDMQTLSLPPMEAHRRALIHQFVGALGLNSKSRGDGQDRFTVLSKTLRTKGYSDHAFDDLIEQKKFRLRLQGSLRGQRQKGPNTRPVVSYKDGETVGASAPELGPENRGRALLEKMGWTKGTALGALDNKGILQPIPHVVKTTKAGLQ